MRSIEEKEDLIVLAEALWVAVRVVLVKNLVPRVHLVILNKIPIQIVLQGNFFYKLIIKIW